MSTEFMNALIARRGYYALSKSSPIPKAQIKSILDTAVKHIPSAFNMQSARVVLLTGTASQSLWATVRTEFLATLGENASAIEMHKAKFDGYATGFGTVLFFEDQATVDKMAAAFPGLAGEFPVWSQNSTGMLQFAVWTALKAEGLGASLQHHGMSPSVAAAITQQLGISVDWKNTAIMPFGVATAEPGQPGREKTFLPVEDRVLDFE